MNPIKVSLKLAKANYAAAKARGDAAACRKYLDEIADLRGRVKAEKTWSASPMVLKLGKPKRTKMQRKIDKINEAAEKAAATSRRAEDPELDEIRWLRGELNAPDAETRRGALEKLSKMLSSDELADVLVADDPAVIVRKSGPSPRKPQAVAAENLGWMVERLADRALAADERNEIVDRLVKAADGDARATQALAKIMTEKVR